MKTLYCIYDRVSMESADPFCSRNDAVAIRLFRNSIREIPNMNQYDLRLYRVGTFDEQTNIVVGATPVEVFYVSPDDEKAADLVGAGQ